MVSEDMKRIVEQFDDKADIDLQDGATEEQIAQFETKHGITLPSAYKEWLCLSDGGELFLPAGVQLYGVVHKPLLDINDSDKPSDDFIVIGALASGDPILCEKAGEQISIFNHDAGIIEEDETYADFTAFLMDLPSLLGVEE